MTSPKEKSNMAYNFISYDLIKDITLADGTRIALNTWAARAVDALVILESIKGNELELEAKGRYIISRLTYATTEQIEAHGGEILNLIVEYLQGAPTGEYEPSGLPRSDEPLIYWDLDSPAIVASFRQAYGIGLDALQKMHYWEFRTLLFALPADTRMGSLFATRSKVIDSKAKGEDRLKEEKIKKSARPKDTRTLEEKEKDAKKQLAAILD